VSTKIDFAEIRLTKENFNINIQTDKGSRGRDRMIVGFTTTYAIGAYHH
jgi:hypothetical protein